MKTSDYYKYIKDISNNKVLSPDELLNKLEEYYSNKTVSVMQDIVLSNLYIVKSVADTIEKTNTQLDIMDLIQEGNYKLVKVIKNCSYDIERKSVTFEAYMYKAVYNHLLDYVSIQYDNYFSCKPYVYREIRKLMNKNDKNSLDKYASLFFRRVSIDDNLYDDNENINYSDIIPSKNKSSERLLLIQNLKHILSKEQFNLLNDYIGITDKALTLQNITDKYNIKRFRLKTALEEIYSILKNNDFIIDLLESIVSED